MSTCQSAAPHPARRPAASIRAEAIVRGRQARPYLADVAHALHARGWTTTDTPPTVQHPAEDEYFAALVLNGPEAPAAGLVWSERHGWRTSTLRATRPGRSRATSSPARPRTMPTL
ncbi:hypothetical protein ACH4C6_34425 [Streptomyces sp. NPDC017943]|uniref:hypothetical protein n=1 Tax=Streptomyces sp. NPDC017943 TaxID=3365019 RepID=UPI0037A4743A